MTRLSIELAFFSVALAAVGTPICYLMMKLFGSGSITLWLMSKVFVSLMLIAVVFHLLCEVTGVNKWYILNGAARLKITSPL